MLDGATHDLTRAASLRAARASSSLMSPARRRASVMSASRCTRSAFSIASCEPAIGDHRVGVRRPRLRHERQRIPDEPLADGLRIELRPRPRAADAARGHRTGTAASTRAAWARAEKQREHRIAQQPGLDEIRARNAEVGECRLERRTVPQRDRHGFLRCQAVIHRDIRRHRRLGVDSDSLGGACAEPASTVPLRSLAGRCARAAHDGEDRRDQGRVAGQRSTTTRRHKTPSQHGKRMIPCSWAGMPSPSSVMRNLRRPANFIPWPQRFHRTWRVSFPRRRSRGCVQAHARQALVEPAVASQGVPLRCDG